MIMEIIGREREKIILDKLVQDDESHFLAVYGRRRIGKTYLIRQYFAKQMVFEVSGLNEKDKDQQLENFWITQYDFEKSKREKSTTWLQAFQNLKDYVSTIKGNKKKVIFLDEIAWFETPKSGFLAALDKFWNQFCSKRSDIILVICGSAASWIIKKVVNNKGGLHNRLTCQIQLQAFDVQETKKYLLKKGIKLVDADLVKLYMCIGGIPYYLRYFEKGNSVDQFINQLFFDENAHLKNEFANLYASLFKNHESHVSVVKALSLKNKGLTRNEILKATKLTSGGGFTKVLTELIVCGFVKEIAPIGFKKEEVLYRLMDEFTVFYFKFLATLKKKSTWLQFANSQVVKIWQGYSFENFILKHINLVKKQLGISGILSNEYSWFFKGNTIDQGTQIDFVIDRADNCINIIEVKFHNTTFEITKDYHKTLLNKKELFIEKTKTKKNVFVTMISLNGVKVNEYYLSAVNNQINLSQMLKL
jgi:AAA+ ATPase superfamily predicted ATPase